MEKYLKYFWWAVLCAIIFVIVCVTGAYYYANYIYYVNYDNIDDVVYAEPSEKAKNFDIDCYINSLPEIEYEKVNYPVKETYEYKFNGYKMTIDIPEGFTAYEIPLTKKPQIRNTKGLADSCLPEFSVCADNMDTIVFFAQETDISDNRLCIVSEKKIEDMTNCNGINFMPEISHFKESLQNSLI